MDVTSNARKVVCSFEGGIASSNDSNSLVFVQLQIQLLFLVTLSALNAFNFLRQ